MDVIDELLKAMTMKVAKEMIDEDKSGFLAALVENASKHGMPADELAPFIIDLITHIVKHPEMVQAIEEKNKELNKNVRN